MRESVSQPTPLLLKPTGVPVFTPSTLDSTTTKAQTEERMVKTKSFVIGKKVENQTGINLIDLENMSVPLEKQFPVKVLYVKPSHEYKSYQSKQNGKEEITQVKRNNFMQANDNQENSLNQANLQLLDKAPTEIPIQKNFPKQTGVGDLQKIKEAKHRPKSATTQQIKKDQIKHNKLGPNTSVKPQISYVNKVLHQQRPQTAKSLGQDKDKLDNLHKQEPKPSQIKPANRFEDKIISPQRVDVDIPFTQNRFQGKFQNLTKDLVKKAQEALMEEKQKALKQKEDILLKKEMQRKIAEEVKQMNQELVQKQKEKGVERVDFRKKELEQKEQQRKDENRQDRQRQKKLRKKRQEEGRKILGLEIHDETKLDDYRKKVKDQLKEEEIKEQKAQKSAKIVDHLKLQNAQKEKPQMLHLNHQNKDLNQIMKEGKAIDEEEEKKQIIDKEKLLKEQKRKRKQMMLEQQMKAEEEKRKKEENMKQLQENTRKMIEEQARKQDQKRRIQEEREKLQKEMEENQQQQNKKKSSKKKKTKLPQSSHKEQMDELRNWIEEQIQQVDESQIDLNQSMNNLNQSLDQQQPQKILVKIDQKNMAQKRQARPQSQQMSAQYDHLQDVIIEEDSQMFEDKKTVKINKLNKLKQDLPGNNEIPYTEDQKFGVRENRYGLYGDNGYGNLVEIKKRQIEDCQKPAQKLKMLDDSVSMERKNEIRLSKEGLVQMINKIQEYQKIKEQELFKDQIEHPEKYCQKDENDNRQVIIQHQKEAKLLRNQSVPGVINVQQEVQRQKQVQQNKELQATKVIQKWSRGFLARQYVRNKRENYRKDIEAEYGYFENQVKFNTDYNLQKFLKEKQKLREVNKTKLVDSMSIQEKIGDSSNSYSKSYRGKSAPQIAQQQPQVQNFIRERSDKDPLSLIEIYARKHAPKIVPSVVKSPLKQDTHLSQKQQAKKVVKQSSIDIDEEIYTESFEQEDEKSIKTGSIDEDIIEGSKGMSSGSFREVKPQKQAFPYKQSTSIIEESIQEDYLMSVNNGHSRNFKSPNKKDDSSIAEESLLFNQNSISKSSHLKRSSMREDSIIDEISDKDGYESISGSANKFKINLEKQRQTQHQVQVAEFEKKMQEDVTKRKKLVNELLDEMKRYEQASVSTVVVERMEKIINSSLAQKDKILMGQRLHELELEKNHKDEINKIREEQIRLLSQLVLLGPNGVGGAGANEEEKKKIMENIQKIIDKPIVINHIEESVSLKGKKPKAHVEQSIAEYDSDYIEESKGLSQRVRSIDEDSIVESIHKDGDDDSIEEEIPEESNAMTEDDIKESIYTEGKKVSTDNKNKSKLAPNAKNSSATTDNGLQKMRMALGSEESIRKQSKNALKKSMGEDNNEMRHSGIFEKNSFQDFQNQKFKQLLFDKDALNDVLVEFERAIEEKKTEKEERIKKKLKKNEISPRTYKKRSTEIEKWVSNERHELHKRKQSMIQSMNEMGSMIKKLDIDKKSMLEKIGSPRPHKRLGDSQSSIDMSDDLDEESNESIRVREARDQVRQINRDLDREDPEARSIEKKKRAAQKLLAEKEKAIEEGLKNKLKKIEQQQADKMLDLALNLDIDKEIEKRIHGAIRQIEESSDNYNEYSARSYSQSLGPVSQSNNDDHKKKKNVKFASPEKFSSAHSHDQSSAGDRSSRYRSSHRIEDSIGESIKIEDSINNVSEYNSKVLESSKRSQSKDKIQDSIKESIPEDKESDGYSDDFIQSQMSDAKSVKNTLEQSRNKLQEKANNNNNPAASPQEDDIEYSMNFDESIGQSQQLSQFQQSQKQMAVASVEQVDEESESEEEDQAEQIKSQNSKVKDSEDSQEDDLGSESLGASSKLVMSNQEIVESAEQQSDDREILQSGKSVEWVIDLQNPDTQRSKKQSDEDDGYSEDFEKIEEDYYDQEEKKSSQDESKQEEDELEDLQSFPDEIAESMEDYNDKVDRITDEFLELLLNEVRENQELKLAKELDEEDFKDKFPFNIIKEEEKAPEPPKPVVTPKVEEKKAEIKRDSQEDQIRVKFDRDTKKLEMQQKEVEQYLELMIQNIDKEELIEQLEKPIEVDPLKKLAIIFSQENVDESFNKMNESGPQFILSLDFFIKIEDDFKRFQIGDKIQDLTESARQSYIQHENIHHKAIFDAFNQALDIERPYKDKGKPAPWSKQTRVLRPKITESDVEKTLKKAKDRVMDWSKTNAGTRVAPLPPAPPANSDYDNQQNQPPIQSEEDRINQAREEKLGVLMMKELVENENKWIDIEDEDTQVKFDLADMVLEELAGEIAAIMLNMRKY